MRPVGVEADAVEHAHACSRRARPSSVSRPSSRDGELADVVAPRVGDVQRPLVEREGEPVRALEVVGHPAAGARHRVDAVDVAAVGLALGGVALVVAVDAVGRVGEPDRPVAADDDVVRAVQPLAVEAVGERRDRAVVLGPRRRAARRARTRRSGPRRRACGRWRSRTGAGRRRPAPVVSSQRSIRSFGMSLHTSDSRRRQVDGPLGPAAVVVQPLDAESSPERRGSGRRAPRTWRESSRSWPTSRGGAPLAQSHRARRRRTPPGARAARATTGTPPRAASARRRAAARRARRARWPTPPSRRSVTV